MTEVNETQIGGEHYQSTFQHWDLVEMIHLPYLEACATKYILRHRKKNGKQDLEKALHFVQKIIENEKGEPFGNRPGPLSLNNLVETKFYRENQVDTNEMCLLRILLSMAPTNNELRYCLEVLQMMIAEFKEVEVPVVKSGQSWNALEFNNSGFGEPPEEKEEPEYIEFTVSTEGCLSEPEQNPLPVGSQIYREGKISGADFSGWRSTDKHGYNIERVVIAENLAYYDGSKFRIPVGA